MSENLDKNQNEFEAADETQFDEESTIFSVPLAHKDKPASNNNRTKILTMVFSCIAVIIVVSISLWIFKNIEKDESEETPLTSLGIDDEIKVVETDSSIFKTVTVTNKNGEFKFIKQQIVSTDQDGNETTTDYWTLDGIDQSKISSITVNKIISASASVTAAKEITQMTAADCGLDNPEFKITITAEGKDPYTILVGGESIDDINRYLQIEGIDTIYSVNKDTLSVFDFEPLDLANTASIPTTMFTVDTSDNKSEDGAYAYFDSLTIEGTLFPQKITIVNNKVESDSASLMPYLTATPSERYANSENLTPFVQLFSSELAVSGCYAFDITDKTIKEFGLDNPDAVITLTIKGESKSFKFSKIDDEYAAVLYDGATMIRKISLSSISFMEFKTEDLYMKNIFLYSVNDLSSLSFKNESIDVKFDISYVVGDDEKKIYTFKANGTELVTSKFQSFYSSLVGIECEDFSVQEVSNSAGTITLVFTDGNTVKIDFYEVNATQYQYSIDGKQMGKISSSSYNKMVNDLDKTAKGE